MRHHAKKSERTSAELFEEINRLLEITPDDPDILVRQARLLMLGDIPEDNRADKFEDVEQCISRALDLCPRHLGALEEAAYFYHAVVPDKPKAIEFAKRYIQAAEEIIDEMQAIVRDPD